MGKMNFINFQFDSSMWVFLGQERDSSSKMDPVFSSVHASTHSPHGTPPFTPTPLSLRFSNLGTFSGPTKSWAASN